MQIKINNKITATAFESIGAEHLVDESKTRKPAIIVSNLHKILEYMTPATWVEAIEDKRQALSIN
jgi:hypothetical protein